MDEPKIMIMIQSQLGNLTKIETMIADYILNFPNCILENNITEMAIKMDVSRNAITRFCKRFGFIGYTDFKYEYTRQVHTFEKRDSITTDIIDVISKKLLDLTTVEIEQNIERITKNIYQHKTIKIIATGKSRVVASYLKYNLQSFGKYIEIIDEITYGGELEYIFNPDDYVLVFTVGSRSNITNQLLTAAIKATDSVDIFTMNKLSNQYVGTMPIILPNIENKLPYKLHNQLIFIVVIDLIINFYTLLITEARKEFYNE